MKRVKQYLAPVCLFLPGMLAVWVLCLLGVKEALGPVAVAVLVAVGVTQGKKLEKAAFVIGGLLVNMISSYDNLTHVPLLEWGFAWLVFGLMSRWRASLRWRMAGGVLCLCVAVPLPRRGPKWVKDHSNLVSCF